MNRDSSNTRWAPHASRITGSVDSSHGHSGSCADDSDDGCDGDGVEDGGDSDSGSRGGDAQDAGVMVVMTVREMVRILGCWKWRQ